MPPKTHHRGREITHDVIQRLRTFILVTARAQGVPVSEAQFPPTTRAELQAIMQLPDSPFPSSARLRMYFGGLNLEVPLDQLALARWAFDRERSRKWAREEV